MYLLIQPAESDSRQERGSVIGTLSLKSDHTDMDQKDELMAGSYASTRIQ